MDIQSALFLLVAIVLIISGVVQLGRSRRRNRAQHQRNRTGVLLILIGGVLLMILVATGSVVLF
jgi:hypothetical protein